MTYLSFLKALLDLGPKLPQVMVLVQHIVTDVQDIIALLKGETFAAEAVKMELNASEQAAEGEVMAALAASPNESFGAIGDGMILRALFQFIKDNPQLMTLILSLLKL